MKTTDFLENHFQLKSVQKSALKRLGIQAVRDLLYHFPHRYGEVAQVKNIGSIKEGEEVLVFGKVKKTETGKTFKGRTPIAKATIEDETGVIKAIWFNQPYIAKMAPEGATVRVEGKIGTHNGKPTFTNPEIQIVEKIPTAVGDSLFGSGDASHAFPVYKESRGVTSRWFYHAIEKVFASGLLDEITDPIPEETLKKYNLPTLKTALVWIHRPKKKGDAEAARKRFSFEEIFFIQLEKQKERKNYESNPSFIIDIPKEKINEFTNRFGFELTESQNKAIGQILKDLKTPVAMSRLLEGDVGSGKTAVAATASYATVTTPPENQDFGNLQVAYMAPTEILAKQHFETFVELFAHMPIQIGLITGSGCKKFPSKVNPTEATNISRTQLLKWVKNGEIPILIGTHSLIQKSVEFENLGLVIIDEQHRFGTKQRFSLRNKKDILPHLLSMTATPIPRTLALTLYGDLDLTLLDTLPAGRKQIETHLVQPAHRKRMYEKIREEIDEGRQAYVICPRIDEPDPAKERAVLAKSVKEEAKHLAKKVYPDLKIGMLHGQMKKDEKESAINEFAEGKNDILVATSVVEVGVNIPNATVIVIEGAERFGLAQLHQLRGRVMRSSHQPYCFVFTESNSKKTMDRLKALTQAKNGFELAEHDLAQRGAGELAGASQSGISDIGMEAIKNIKMVEASRNEAQNLIETDPKLKKHPLIKSRLEKSNKVHFE